MRGGLNEKSVARCHALFIHGALPPYAALGARVYPRRLPQHSLLSSCRVVWRLHTCLHRRCRSFTSVIIPPCHSPSSPSPTTTCPRPALCWRRGTRATGWPGRLCRSALKTRPWHRRPWRRPGWRWRGSGLWGCTFTTPTRRATKTCSRRRTPPGCTWPAPWPRRAGAASAGHRPGIDTARAAGGARGGVPLLPGRLAQHQLAGRALLAAAGL